MRRVLRPDGRIALFEPINRRMFPEPADRLWGYDVAAVADLAGAVKARYRDDRDPAAAAMMDFDELDLLRLAQEAGFTRLHLECHTDVEPAAHMRAIDLDTLLDMSPNPTAPTLREALADALGPVHRERFLAHMQAAVAGETTPVRRSVVAYLAARRSG
jgi:hypothetical protein